MALLVALMPKWVGVRTTVLPLPSSSTWATAASPKAGGLKLGTSFTGMTAMAMSWLLTPLVMVSLALPLKCAVGA